jgi:hypothetical protein
MHQRFLIVINALLPIALTFLASFTSYKNIVLQNEPIPLKADGYYIAGITDNRLSKIAVAQLLVKTPDGKFTTQPNDLQGGAQVAINRFLDRNLSVDPSTLPVIINIKEIKVIESQLPNNRVDGQVKLTLNFGLQKEYGTDPLVTYQGGMHYIRPADNLADIEPQLRKTLINSLIFFNKWIKLNMPVHIKLVKYVKINFKDYKDKAEEDTIYYATNRPLTWDDFKSNYKPHGTYAAAVMPSIGYDQHSSVKDGTVYVDITMKTFLPKSTCWVNSFSKDDYTLNHEQRHFDIVKIIAEQYKHKILSANLTPDTYEAFINMEYLEAYRNMNIMQKAYDEETRHGRDQDAQFSWNERIDKDLQLAGVTKRNLP